jgi:hypothetical protein
MPPLLISVIFLGVLCLNILPVSNATADSTQNPRFKVIYTVEGGIAYTCKGISYHSDSIKIFTGCSNTRQKIIDQKQLSETDEQYLRKVIIDNKLLDLHSEGSEPLCPDCYKNRLTVIIDNVTKTLQWVSEDSNQPTSVSNIMNALMKLCSCKEYFSGDF